ncbi:VWA domain-containing protein [Patiriisocius marinistellae]|uniref:VWA domain-containing protein n=1 Tax=Patiriisocius marinistellae TaxID=2494560 RepID=UPI00125E1C6A|nr:VWA domain-containing protein [Patiriisocius marinistellae]
MFPETILYIVIAVVISLIISVFMYGYKSRYTGNLRWLFGALRFVTLFSILLLLINPKFKSETYTVVKPQLPIVLDNSSSITELGQTENVAQVLNALENSETLNERFDVSYFQFGNGFTAFDSLSFLENNTNISKAFSSINELYETNGVPLLLVSDGNQTLGEDYEFATRSLKGPVYPVILGDSTKYTDLKIQQLNTNRYAFLKNKFPVEAVLVYSGTGTKQSQFVINQGNAIVHREMVSFNEQDNTKTVSITLPASSVGLQRYTAQIVPLSDEKNKVNNLKRFAVEVIDQATNVLIVSKVLHPDLGMLKKAITTNEQRTVTFKKPSEAASVLNDYQLIILYQPDGTFSSVYQEIAKLNKNTFVIAGEFSDWNFINNAQELYTKEVTNQKENVSARLNLNYGTFAIDPIGFSDFPPLKSQFGELNVMVPHETILEQTVDGFGSGSPMLATIELNGTRHAIWDGEGLWKWRAQSYLRAKSFEEFDEFLGKMVQYLASNKRRSRLEVSSETFYYNNNPLKISAQYFDKNFVFDNRASVSISVVNTESKQRQVFPLLLKNNYYEVDLGSLDSGEYSYTVSVKDEEVARSGSFTILEFDIEKQFLNANISKLNRLASKTDGASFFPSEINSLIDTLVNDDSYRATQKSEQKVVPLIDWKYLLGLITLCLALEWFIRKYNGLI